VASELVEGLVLLEVVVQLLPLLPVVSTAECGGEPLGIRLAVQMPFKLVFWQLINQLTPTMSMESVSLMEHLVTTSGPMLLVYLRDSIEANETTVHAATLVIVTMHTLHHDQVHSYCEFQLS
jgi:hypothetical protein